MARHPYEDSSKDPSRPVHGLNWGSAGGASPPPRAGARSAPQTRPRGGFTSELAAAGPQWRAEAGAGYAESADSGAGEAPHGPFAHNWPAERHDSREHLFSDAGPRAGMFADSGPAAWGDSQTSLAKGPQAGRRALLAEHEDTWTPPVELGRLGGGGGEGASPGGEGDPFDDAHGLAAGGGGGGGPAAASPEKEAEREARRAARAARRRRRKLMRMPWFTWFVSVVQVCVFIAELARMGQLTGSPIQTKPSFNPMIGPSTYCIINMGGRFTPCMRYMPGITTNSSLVFPCANTTNPDTESCTLADLCGFGMNPARPAQWWRFFTAIFLHAGFIHIGFNLLLQIKLGGDLEHQIGHVRYILIYLIAGIGGFLLSGNFAGSGMSSVGASGALFGVIAIDLLDLLYNWQLYKSPKVYLAIHIADIVICFVLGLLPGLDNFAHIGGFAMGLLTGLALLRSPLLLRLKSEEERRPQKRFDVVKLDVRHPMQHFVGRSRGWWAWWLVRLAAGVLVIVYYVVLIKNFETGRSHCSWCKYLSCLPVHGWCDQGDLLGQ